MRSKLILIIILAAALLLASTESGSAAKKVSIKAEKTQTAVTKPAQQQVPAKQPTTTDLSESSTVISPASVTPGSANTNLLPQAGEEINWQVLASGGGIQTLGTLVLGSTIGQTAAGSSTVGTYTLQSGFWQNFSGGYLCGDADGSGDIDIADAVYIVAYIFSGGAAPSPLESGDADCDGGITIADVVYLVAYIFSGGPVPCASCK